MPTDDRVRHAIRHELDKTLLIEAAAGTGKTTELIHRIVNLLGTGKTTIGRLVAVTFTEKAAAELKLRLRERLDRVRAREGNPDRRRNLEHALTHLEEAHIDTIHGFCTDLLRERPIEAGVDPAFAVLAEPQAKRTYRRVFDDWFTRMLEQPPEGLRRGLTRRHDDEDERGGGAGPVDRLRDAGWALVEWRDFPARWRRDPAFDRAQEIERLRTGVRAFARLTRSPARKGDNLAVDTDFIRQASRDLDDEVGNGRADLDELEGRLVALARHRDRPRIRRGSGVEFGPGVLRATVIAERDVLFQDLDAFARAADADLAATLRSELAETVERYQLVKSEAGQLDFTDLLIRARDLVRHHADVRSDFQRRFDTILVDEFQDTDPIQAEILLLLATDDPTVDDWRAVTVTPGKLFIVADPKQSIYRFRRADVGIYEEVKEILGRKGVVPLPLSKSFRAVPSIQRFVNHVFAPLMHGDAHALQADYVPLEPWRSDADCEPDVAAAPVPIVALPVPAPYAISRISGAAIEKSLPDAVGAFVSWLLGESGWTVTERTPLGGSARRVKIAPRHVCLLFRRFESWGRDVTRPYLRALEARNVPHLLVGGRSFHDREEIETMKAALSAIEWPDDELSVFAALRGPLFALSDVTLLAWRQRVGRFSPFRVPDALPGELADVGEALRAIRRLHLARNSVPVADTVGALLEITRAHAALALRPSGEQALANVLHIAELGRRYELAGGISFRGFVEDLVEGQFGDETEAPILEEGGDGVRIMTLHRAKGLEFPVVVLCDITANLAPRRAARHLDPAAGLCAVKLAGCAPHELLDHEADELARERAEGIRIAYVAATRARDVLVVPCVGDEPYDRSREKWVSMLNDGLYPTMEHRRSGRPADGCPVFPSKDTVLERPGGDASRPDTVAPGLFHMTIEGVVGSVFRPGDSTTGSDLAPPTSYPVVWWDPRLLKLGAEPPLGLRETELIGKDADAADVAADLAAYQRWDDTRVARIAFGRTPSLVVTRATVRAAAVAKHAATRESSSVPLEDIPIVELPRDRPRPSGARYGALVHAVLAIVPLDAEAALIERIARSQARLAGATEEETVSAADAVRILLGHDLLGRARRAAQHGRCRRETPVAFLDADGSLVEGQVDLAFEEDEGWQVVDFKTDRDLARDIDAYREQIALYARALSGATGRPARGTLVRV
jgi:ATP-dependent exoDNAse (exonuclease V) beta subunit